MSKEKIFKITPSGVDYALKCKRCLWLSYKGIKLDAFFPPIFNSFDLIQKKFLILAVLVGIVGVGVGAITIFSMISELYSP